MQNIPGFYGKLPALGDFVKRRLPSEFVQPWDEWLQQSIAASKNALQESWLDHYLNSPIWRFVLSSGLCGGSSWAGLLMPSVDRVGRYYPLVISCRLPDNENLISVMSLSGAWFELASEAILSVLEEESIHLESFDERVVSLGSLDAQFNKRSQKIEIGFGTAWQIPLNSSNLANPISALTHQLLLQRLGAYSVWWGAGSSKVAPSFLTCAGLPQATDFATMLNGNWNAGSWELWPT